MTLVFFRIEFYSPFGTPLCASFRRSFCKSFAAMCMLLLAAHRAVSSANWDFEFCLW